MKKMTSRLFSMIVFLTLALSFASCKEKSLVGRSYSGDYNGHRVTVSFEKDGSASFGIADKMSASLEYTEEKGSFSGYNTSSPAMEFEGKYDDEALLWVWWGGNPVILYRTDGTQENAPAKNITQRKTVIEGRTFQAWYDGEYYSISFKKFGLVEFSINDRTEYAFYKENKKAKTVTIRERYDESNDEDDESALSFNYDDNSLRGVFDDEEIILEDLDKKIDAWKAQR